MTGAVDKAKYWASRSFLLEVEVVRLISRFDWFLKWFQDLRGFAEDCR